MVSGLSLPRHSQDSVDVAATLPAVRYDDESARTTCTSTDRHPIPLGRIPLSCSFGMFQSCVPPPTPLIEPQSAKTDLQVRTHFLPDPTALETPLLPTTIVIALDEDGRACVIRQEGMGGQKGKNAETLLSQAWVEAEKRCKELRRVLDEACR